MLGSSIALLLFFGLVRFADGPVGPVAGGPFQTGEFYRGPEPDWSPANEWREVEVALLEDAPHLPGVVRELARKYYGRPEELPLTGESLEQQVVDSLKRVREGALWIFELAPRVDPS